MGIRGAYQLKNWKSAAKPDVTAIANNDHHIILVAFICSAVWRRASSAAIFVWAVEPGWALPMILATSSKLFLWGLDSMLSLRSQSASNLAMSATPHSRFVMQAEIAGVSRCDLWILQKLQYAKSSAASSAWVRQGDGLEGRRRCNRFGPRSFDIRPHVLPF